MKKFFVWKSIFLGFLGIGIFFSSGWAKVLGIDIYRQGIFLEEEFTVSSGKNFLLLSSLVPKENVRISLISKGLKIASLSFLESYKETSDQKKWKSLQERKEKLKSQIFLLKKEEELLEKSLVGKAQGIAPAQLEEFYRILERLETEKTEKQRELKKIEKEISFIEPKIPPEKVTGILLFIQGPTGQKGKLRIYYPASDLIKYKENFNVRLSTLKKKIYFEGQLFLRQTSGERWDNIVIHFYTRNKPYASLAPSPFIPWYLDFWPHVRALTKEWSKGKLKEMLPLLKKEREFSPGGFWERVDIKGVEIPPGEEVMISLGREEVSCKKFFIEVAAYLPSPHSFLAAEIIPSFSTPQTKANFYVDEKFVGQGILKRLLVGQKTTLYFGEASLLEVKRVILKDTSGKTFIFGNKEKIEKVFKTTIINHYPKSLEISLIDRIPISKRKEIKVKVASTPPWKKISPEGKAFWSWVLKPKEKKEVLLSIQIIRPKKEK